MTTPLESSETDRASAPTVIPILAESVDVRKVAVDRGGYAISKRVKERHEVVEAMLTERDADVERRPVNRALGPDEGTAPYYEGETLVIPVVKEVLVTEKRLMLVEEIRVRVTERQLPFRGEAPLREERVAIERLAPDVPDGGLDSAAPSAAHRP